jgi:hypothetical protein
MFEIDLEVSSFVGINAQPALDHFEPCQLTVSFNVLLRLAQADDCGAMKHC